MKGSGAARKSGSSSKAQVLETYVRLQRYRIVSYRIS